MKILKTYNAHTKAELVLTDGKYKGIQRGYTITIELQNLTVTCEIDKGIRGTSPIKFTVKDGIITKLKYTTSE